MAIPRSGEQTARAPQLPLGDRPLHVNSSCLPGVCFSLQSECAVKNRCKVDGQASWPERQPAMKRQCCRRGLQRCHGVGLHGLMGRRSRSISRSTARLVSTR